MTPRSAPYLWIQLINGGALPLEALLLLLLLAGADPGPLPLFERLLAWGLGAAAPALLLWRRPADPRSLLLVRFSNDEPGGGGQPKAVFSLIFAGGVLALLPLLGWLDRSAALADRLSPLQGADRLACLLAASTLMALMVWQWQQLLQAIWLLGGRSLATLETRNLGLPLPHLPSLAWPTSEGSVLPTAIEPEQAGEHDEGTDLDQQIS
jgi:hypothetical protein